MFYIGFTSAARTDDAGWLHAVGALTLGRATEGFESDLGTWSMADYERQWREGVARLLGGHTSSALLTSYRGPDAAYHFMWPVWREGTDAIFQERLLLTEQLDEPFTTDRLYEVVGERMMIDEEGQRVAEWVVPLGHLANFLIDR